MKKRLRHRVRVIGTLFVFAVAILPTTFATLAGRTKLVWLRQFAMYNCSHRTLCRSKRGLAKRLTSKWCSNLLRQLWPDKDLDIARVHQRKRAAGSADVHRLPVGTVGVAVAVGLGVTVEVGVGVTVGVAVAVAVGVGVGLGDARVLKVLSPP